MDKFGPAGETIMDYTIYDAARAGFGKIVFVIRRDIEEDFNSEIISKLPDSIKSEYVFQELDDIPEHARKPENRTKPWGTGHAVYAARNKIAEPFAVVNADDFYGASSFKILFEELTSIDAGTPAACMVGYQLHNTLSDSGSVSRGICEVINDQLVSVVERRKIFRGQDHPYYLEGDNKIPLTGAEIASMNLVGFTPEVFPIIHESLLEFLENAPAGNDTEYYLPTIMEELIERNNSVRVVLTPEKWFGVTYKEDKSQVEQKLQELIRAGQYPSSLWG